MKQGFEYNSTFNTDSSFTSIKFGYDKPVLETELNEMQEIQNHNRKLLTNKICKSGIIELVDKDFMGKDIIYNPNNELNKIAIAPMKVMINGHEIHVCGNYKVGEISSYIDIDLGEAPTGEEDETKFRQDLVFLQVWLEEFDENDLMRRYGHTEGTIIPNTIVDARVGKETSHRMVLKWKIRTTNILNKFMDFDRWEYGFGFENNGIGNFVRIETDVIDGINIINDNYDKIFANATHYMFKGCMFYGDNNLWVAGRPHRDDPSNTKDTEFVYALPLFRVDRRNKKVFDIGNSYGSRCFDEQNINTRPDNKCYDLIYPSDIVDLRKTVIIGDNDVNYYLDNTLNQIFTGTLSTKSNEQMRRIQFGIEPLIKKSNYESLKSKIAFLDSFNRGQAPHIGKTPEKNPSEYNLVYRPSATEWGLNVDGKFSLTYGMNGPDLTAINTNEGTLEFFICPSWNGFDILEQSILTLYYQASTDSGFFPFLDIKKCIIEDKDKKTQNSRLVIKRYADVGNDVVPSTMNVNINNISKDRIYHFRICWSVKNNDFDFYINGQKVGNSLDSNITRTKDIRIGKMQLGTIETSVKNNTGFLIDELVIFTECFGDSNWTIPKDYKDGNAIILPSFNGIFRNYRSNEFEQKNMVTYIQTTDLQTSFSIDAPYGTVFGRMDSDNDNEIDNAKVYCMKLSESSPANLDAGTELKGKFTGAMTNQLTFNLDEDAISNYATFKGETVAIVYSLLIPSSNNIDDIPNELLKSEVYEIGKKASENISEVSFNVENKTGSKNNPREVQKLVTITRDEKGNIVKYEPVRNIYNVHDTAYDFSTLRNETNRDFAFSRLLEYYKEGENVNTYFIDLKLYGYDVLYVRKAEIITNDIDGFEEVEQAVIQEAIIIENKIRVTLNKVVESGQKIKFELGLGGTTFDYNSNSKTYVGNICKAKMLEFESTGDKYEYVIPLDDLDNLGICNNGVLLAAGVGYLYKPAYSNDPIESSHICYNNDRIQSYELLDNEDDNAYNKPFIKIRIQQEDREGTGQKVPAGNIIKIPVFITYQPKSTDILSVWYNYNPYQGILNVSNKKIKRLSDWKYFITTLSSSGENDKYNVKNSLNNVINRLPGGSTACSYIKGQQINLKGHNLHEFASKGGYEVNKNLIFINQTYFGSEDNNIDKSFFDLKTVYTINKRFGTMQDDNVILKDIDYVIYLPMNESIDGQTGSINRYCGMSCVVMNEFGDLYVLIIGDTNNNTSTNNNYVCPTYGDMFMIPYRPSVTGRF